MLSALRAYPGSATQTNLRGWLLGSPQRRRSTRTGRGPPAGPGGRGAGAAGAAPAAIPSRRSGEQVRRLPEKQRAAVTLRFAGDLDYAAIGEGSGCSEAAARQNVRAGLASVRREWVHESTAELASPDGRRPRGWSTWRTRAWTAVRAR